MSAVTDHRHDLHNDLIVSKELRAKALWIVERNLRGDRRLEARRFLRSPQRTEREIQNFIERMQAGGAE